MGERGQEDTEGQEAPGPAEAPRRKHRTHLAEGCQQGACSARGLFTAGRLLPVKETGGVGEKGGVGGQCSYCVDDPLLLLSQ